MSGEDLIKKEEARARRRRRRKREQRFYTFIVILFVLLIAGGVFFGYVMLSGNNPLAFLFDLNAGGQSAQNVQMQERDRETTLSDVEVQTRAEQILAQMTLEEKVSALFILPFDTLSGELNAQKATKVTKRGLESYSVSGVIFNSGNVQSKKQLMSMLSDTRKYAKYPILMFFEENGGAQNAVAVAMEETSSVAAPGVIAQNNNPTQAFEAGKTIGAYLYAAGFDVNLSPIANISSGDESYIYSADPQTAFNMSTSMLNGLKEAGMFTCTGRFPVLTGEDPGGMQGISSVNTSLNDLRSSFFLPFGGCISAGTDMIMMSSIQLPRALSASTPATLSDKLVTDILRGELGYTGVVVSAPLNQMNIVRGYTPDNAAVTAILAGVDLLYAAEDFEMAYQGIMTALSTGVLTEERINESLMRILKLSCQK